MSENKYLEKIAGRYFYNEAKHFAEHAKDMEEAATNRFGFKNPFSDRGFNNFGEYDFRAAFNRRSQPLVDKARILGAQKGGVIGAGIGGISGAMPSKKYEDGKFKNKTLGDRIKSTLSGAAFGGLAGAAFGANHASTKMKYKIFNRGGSRFSNVSDKTKDRAARKFAANDGKFDKEFEAKREETRNKSNEERKDRWEEYDRKTREEYSRHNSNRESPPPRNSKRGINEIQSDLGISPGSFTTKAEAKKHYKRMAMKHHPDRGGNPEEMKKINSAWDEYQKHPEGFEKLASNVYLEKLAELGLL